VHFIALIGARFDAPVPNSLETSDSGRCGTYDRDIFIWLLWRFTNEFAFQMLGIVDYFF